MAFDIETVPLAASMALPYIYDELQPPANYKSDEAIAKWRDADMAAWDAERIKRYSLNPRLGRVVAISYAWDDDAVVHVSREESHEAAALADFWENMRDAHGSREAPALASWNGIGFDLPFLLVRSAIVGIDPGINIAPYLRRYSVRPHFDGKCIALNWDVRQKGEGLDEWATAFGLGGVKTAHGSDVYGMVERGEWDRLEEYARQDALLTWAVCDKLRRVYGMGNSTTMVTR